MFFNVLGSIATFITGTLAGILIGNSGAKEIMSSIEEKKLAVESSVAAPAQSTTLSAETIITDPTLDPNYN
jgi:hypothetical protein